MKWKPFPARLARKTFSVKGLTRLTRSPKNTDKIWPGELLVSYLVFEMVLKQGVVYFIFSMPNFVLLLHPLLLKCMYCTI